MSIHRFSIGLAAIVALLFFSYTASAQYDGRVEHYRFLPRTSVINQSGGFAGFNIDYRVTGEFDFRVLPSMLAVYPPVHVAKFENVEATGKHPMHADLDVDSALNLSGLLGWELLHPQQRGVFRFRGETGDGSAVDLLAKLEGPWLYMRGGTTPPAGSADFFEYHIKAIARRAPSADFNGDEKVDGADLAAWSSGGASGGDFLEWQRQLGETPPSIASLDAAIDAALATASTGTASPVPEPSALMLGLLAAVLSWSSSRQCRK